METPNSSGSRSKSTRVWLATMESLGDPDRGESRVVPQITCRPATGAFYYTSHHNQHNAAIRAAGCQSRPSGTARTDPGRARLRSRTIYYGQGGYLEASEALLQAARPGGMPSQLRYRPVASLATITRRRLLDPQNSHRLYCCTRLLAFGRAPYKTGVTRPGR